MKLVKEKEYRLVDYFGIPVRINKNIKCLAADENGLVYGYNKRPICTVLDCWLEDISSNSESHFIMEVDLEGMDWKDTLLEIDDVTKGE